MPVTFLSHTNVDAHSENNKYNYGLTVAIFLEALHSAVCTLLIDSSISL